MKTAVIILATFVAVTAAIAIYLVATTPAEPATLQLPLATSQRELLSAVPASADAFALVPRAAALHRRLLDNPIAGRAVGAWTSKQAFPRRWMIGGADLAAWRIDGRTRYALRLDPFRALLVRTYLLVTGGEGRWDGKVFVVGSGSEPRIDAAELDALLAVANRLPPGHALAIQRDRSRGVFPPIAKPSATVITIGEREIAITSRAIRSEERRERTSRPLSIRYPRGALVTAVFREPPEAIGDLNRLVRTRVSTLLEDGGAIALYDVESGALLPRPREVIILPATDERRDALRKFVGDLAPQALRDALGFRIETADTGSELLVAFDRQSIDRYRRDSFVEPRFRDAEWSAYVDAARAGPVLERVTDSAGLRYATPRLFRSARDLERWIGGLEGAGTIEAAVFKRLGEEELRVVIAPK